VEESRSVSTPQPRDVWARFSHDPRDPQAAALRAADRDRDVVVEVLGEAYGDGRLDSDEFDVRSTAVASAKILGDLPPLIEDLVPIHGVASMPALATAEELRAKAVRAWKRELRQAVGGMAGPSVLTTGIWGATAIAAGDPYFFWPAFVILGTGANMVRVMFSKDDIVERKLKRLETEQRKELERRRRDEGN